MIRRRKMSNVTRDLFTLASFGAPRSRKCYQVLTGAENMEAALLPWELNLKTSYSVDEPLMSAYNSATRHSWEAYSWSPIPHLARRLASVVANVIKFHSFCGNQQKNANVGPLAMVPMRRREMSRIKKAIRIRRKTARERWSSLQKVLSRYSPGA